MIKQLGLLSLLILALSCKKEIPTSPVNSNENNPSNNELDCTTCPSIFYTFPQAPSCDDFTYSDWLTASFTGGDTIGFTQNETHLIQVDPGGIAEINNGFPGLFFTGPINFAFGGDNQELDFTIYGYYSQYAQYGFSINGSATNYLDGTFPITVDGVTVDLDTSIANILGFEYANLSFSGTISSIEFEGFESGITELCVTHLANTSSNPAFEAINFTDFIDYSGTITGSYPTTKTPLGFYGLQGASMVVDFNKFLGYSPTKISFVHSHSPTSSNLLNVQLPGTPLLVASPSELNALLSNYGYQTEVYSSANGLMWKNEFSPPNTGMQVDSIVILGENISTIQIGANLMESELRSICSYP